MQKRESRFCTLSPTILSARSVWNKCIHPAHDYFVEVQSQLILYVHPFVPIKIHPTRTTPPHVHVRFSAQAEGLLHPTLYSSALILDHIRCFHIVYRSYLSLIFAQECNIIHSYPRRDSRYTVHRVNPFPVALQLRMDETNSE